MKITPPASASYRPRSLKVADMMIGAALFNKLRKSTIDVGFLHVIGDETHFCPSPAAEKPPSGGLSTGRGATLVRLR
jgi:hypothetical protein